MYKLIYQPQIHWNIPVKILIKWKIKNLIIFSIDFE